MRALLKALGLTIWGAIGILLSVIFVVIAFEVALKFRASSALDLEKELGPDNQTQSADAHASVALPDRAPDLRALPDRAPDLHASEALPRAADETDCDARGAPRTALDASQRARLARLLDNSAAAKAESGAAFVVLGEKYYGFGEYELAIESIERGLEMGNFVHLENAYVYLGRSEVAIGDLDAARAAFAKLKDVPDISPRVLRLWTLYAEMLSRGAEKTAPSAECKRAQP